MGSFEDIFTAQNNVNAKVGEIMGLLWTRIQENPEDEFNQYLMKSLQDVAISLIDCQRELTSAYCKDDYKETVLSGLDDEENRLNAAISYTNGVIK
jgi:hypothetical protein